MRPDLAYAALTHNVRFVVVDLETTDSDDGVRAISLGVVPWVDGRQQGAFEVFANPGCSIETTWLHGITDDQVAHEPPFARHLPALEEALKQRRPTERVVLVAHNAKHDVPAVLLEYQRDHRTPPDVAVLDTVLLSRHLRPGASNKLGDALAAFGLALTNHHQALADAQDTARLLDKLLRLAAEQGHSDLDALIATIGSHRSTSDFAPAPGERGRPWARSPHTYIERPAEHAAAHTRLTPTSDTSAIDAWMTGVHECVTLRCPLLLDRCRQVPAPARADIAGRLLDNLRVHLAAQERVDATTTLVGLLGVLERRPGSRADAETWFQQLEELLRDHPRCGTGSDGPTDACPACRAGAPCPVDVWPIDVAGWTLARTTYTVSLAKWTATIAKRYATEPLLATAQARVMAHNCVSGRRQRVDPAPILDKAFALGMTDPRLAHLRARQLARTGDTAAAVAVCETVLASRNGSTDPAWTDLANARAGLLARTRRPWVGEPSAFRKGRSAPENRPTRRRFTPR